MNPDFPRNPRDELEASLTALILGELPADHAFTLGRAIERDAELSKLYERLKRTIELVRQTAANPTDESVSQSAPLKMGDQRRQQLLAHFKTVAPKQFAAPPRRRTRWLVPLAAAAAVMFLAAITIPNLSRAKRSAQSISILDNLRQLDGAKQQWALENGKSANDVPTLSDLIPFMGRGSAGLPQPVMGETYVLGRVGELPTAELDAAQAKKSFKGLAITQPALGKASKRVRLSPDGQLAFVDKSTIVDSIAEQPTLGYFSSSAAPAPSAAAPAAAGPIGAPSAEPEAFRRRYGLQANPVPSGQRSQTGAPSEPSTLSVGGTAKPSLGAIVLPPSGDFADAEKKPALQEQALVLGQRPGGANFFDTDGRGLPVRAESKTETLAEPSRDRAGVDSINNPQWTTGLEKPAQQTPTRNPFISRNGYVEPAAITAGGQPATPGLQNQGGGGGGGGGGAGGGMTPPRQLAAGQETLQFSHQAAPTTPPTDSASAIDPATGLPQSAGIDPATGLPVAPAIDPTTGLPVTVDIVTTNGLPIAATVAPPGLLGENETWAYGQVPRRRSGSVKGGTTQKEAEDNKSPILSDSPKPGKMFGADHTNSGALQAGRSKLEIPPNKDASNLAWGTVKSGVNFGEDIRTDRSKQGNIGLADGTVQPFSHSRLQEALRNSGDYNGQTLYRDLQPGPPNPKDAAQKASGSIVLPTQETATTAPHEEKSSKDAQPSAVADQHTTVSSAVEQAMRGQDTEKNRAYFEAKQKLDDLIRFRDLLRLKVASEGINAAPPKTAMDEIVSKAVAQPTQTPGLLEGIHGAVSGEVERTARISITDRQVLGGYDPFFLVTEFEVIKSDPVLGKVVEELKLDEAWASKHGGRKPNTAETIQLLKKSLDLRAVPNTGVVEIGAKADNPEEAAKIANAVAEAYQKQRREQRKELAMGEIKVIQQRLAEQESKVREAQAKADSLRKESESEQADVAVRKPATNAPIPQPEVQTRDSAFSTFSLNVSDVSFKLAAASLEKGVMPDPASVRSEEFINAFDYRDPEPPPGAPIAFAWERARYPFAQNRDLLRFSIKTAAQGRQADRPLNIVLLLDNSGSMERADRVGIIHEALRVLAAQLQAQDTLSVVTFARTARLWVDGVSGDQAAKVAEEVSNLTPQGGTNLEDAMNLAYQTALRHYLANGINRVVLLTDGAANLGNVEPEALKQKVETNRKQGVALDCFGIGWEGYNDDLLEVLSRNGDGRYGFINTPEEAATEFAGQLAGALRVAASDVKVQVEYNAGRVTAYRQIGYAKHQLTKEQFHDNTVDAAEIGAAESGNALYLVELNPAGNGPLGMVRVRYKVPGTTDYREQEWAVPYSGNAVALEQASPALRLAATASAFSEWLVASPYAGEVTPDRLLGYLSGVPEVYGADARPKKLEWMIRQANSIAGK